ncbi:MAG: hypothetical protein ACKVP5_05680 [Aestuariivirga sp.]
MLALRFRTQKKKAEHRSAFIKFNAVSYLLPVQPGPVRLLLFGFIVLPAARRKHPPQTWVHFGAITLARVFMGAEASPAFCRCHVKNGRPKAI